MALYFIYFKKYWPKNNWLRLRWLRQRLAEAETEITHLDWQFLLLWIWTNEATNVFAKRLWNEMILGHDIKKVSLFYYEDYLVSTYVVCERLSVIQKQARLPEFFDQIGNNTLFWDLVQNTPSPMEMKSWSDLGTLSFDYYRTPPSQKKPNLGRSWHFEFWLLQNSPTSKTTTTTYRLQLEYVETNRCILQGYHLVP